MNLALYQQAYQNEVELNKRLINAINQCNPEDVEVAFNLYFKSKERLDYLAKIIKLELGGDLRVPLAVISTSDGSIEANATS